MGEVRRDAAPASIRLLDPPDVVRRKVARAVTDSDTGPDAVRAAPRRSPGVTNLLDILEACGGSADGHHDVRRPEVGGHRRGRGRRWSRCRSGTPSWPPTRRTSTSVFAAGSARCREVTASVLADATAAMGL